MSLLLGYVGLFQTTKAASSGGLGHQTRLVFRRWQRAPSSLPAQEASAPIHLDASRPVPIDSPDLRVRSDDARIPPGWPFRGFFKAAEPRRAFRRGRGAQVSKSPGL